MKTDNIMMELDRFNFLLDKFTTTRKTENGKIKKPLMDVPTYVSIVLSDPTTIVSDDFESDIYTSENHSKIKKAGEYTQWLLKNYIKPELSGDEEYINGKENPEGFKEQLNRARRIYMEDLFKVKEDLKEFTKYKNYFPTENRDINKYTPKSLYQYLSNFEVPEKFKEVQMKKEIRIARVGYNHPGAVIDFVGEYYTVVKITDTGKMGQDAASWYGGYYDHKAGESKWCTSPKESSNFNYYIKKGPLYVILPNDDGGNVGSRTGLPIERYQFHFQDSQFKDREDFDVNLHTFLSGKGVELKEYFKPEFIKNIKSISGKKIEVDYPSDSASKFIAIYGFDEFFNGLPNDIVNLLFNNKSKDELDLELPKTISRFQNLEVLMLMNCVKKIPNEISDLKNLQFLSLPNNSKLTELPSNILKLKKLKFITLKGSSVKPSSELLEVFNEMGTNTFFFTKKSN
jgi:hypothetical protein